jgi:threonine dehydratase
MTTDTNAKSADLGMTIEARDNEHATEIRARLENAGFVLR